VEYAIGCGRIDRREATAQRPCNAKNSNLFCEPANAAAAGASKTTKELSVKHKSLCIALFMLPAVLATNAAHADDLDEDDVRAGKRIAMSICSRCHIASFEQGNAPLLKPPGPSFIIMAKRNRLSDEELRGFLGAPHHSSPTMRKMPDVPLSGSQIDQLVQYFKSLKAYSQ